MKKNKMMKSELWKKVDEILWEDWDPIGVNDYGGVKDEYRGYIPSIVKLLEEDRDVHKISKTLYHHAKVNMGLTTKLEDHIDTAIKLKNLNK